MRTLVNRCTLMAAATLGLVSGLAAATPSFTPLGFPSGSGFSQATGVSDDGRFVSGHVGTPTGFAPTIWDGTTGSMQLVLPAGFESGGAYVNAISGDGRTAVAIGLGPSGFQGIRWDPSGMPHVLPTAPGTFSSFNAINYDGSVVAGVVNDDLFGGGSDAVIWTEGGGTQVIGRLPGWTGAASFTGVSNDGSQFVGFATDTVRRAVRWNSADGWQVLAGPAGGGGMGMAIDISADGGTVVGTSEVGGSLRPVFWDSAGDAHVIDLWAGYEVGEAVAATLGGTVIVGNWRETEFSDELGSLAFIWDADNGARPLQDMLTSVYGIDLQGYVLNSVTDVTPDGLTFVGTALNPFGELEAFRVTIPSPGGVALLAAAGLLGTRRRR